MSMNFNYLLKFVIIGDSGVGKSNILLRYINNTFSDEFKTTVGVEFGAKNLEVNGRIYRIQIWDTAGQENFRSIARAYYKNSVCACVVYDITNRNSFNSIQSWIDDCVKQSPKSILWAYFSSIVQIQTSVPLNVFPLSSSRRTFTNFPISD